MSKNIFNSLNSQNKSLLIIGELKSYNKRMNSMPDINVYNQALSHITAICVRCSSPVFSRIVLIWFRTVPLERNSLSAIC